MRINYKKGAALLVMGLLFSACGTLEKASLHGLNSGYYRMKENQQEQRDVYLDVSTDRIEVYSGVHNKHAGLLLKSLTLAPSDSLLPASLKFKKQSLDIDVTSILLKYRPSQNSLPAQLTTDFNVALYAGWRHDTYRLKSKIDPLGKTSQRVIARGFDFGVFAGPGTTPITPFTTGNRKSDEYSAMILQSGVAGFIESDVASFGLAVGTDVLLNEDRNIWIYTDKLWIGFVIGIALN